MSLLSRYEYAASLSCSSVGSSSNLSLRSTGQIFVKVNVPCAFIVFSGSVTIVWVS